MSVGRKAALLDLDGTLTDPFVGITTSIQYAMEKMGAQPPTAEDLRWCIGPPLWSSFKILLETDDFAIADKAVAYYRERYASIGLFENKVFDGVPEMLARLKEQGLFLSLATSKAITYTRRIMDHFELSPYFDALHGSELDGTRSDKKELIAHILTTEQIAPGHAVMVGDRKHDIIGARANGVRAIAVSYGYSAPGEFAEHGPDAVCDTPEAVADAVLSWAGVGK